MRQVEVCKLWCVTSVIACIAVRAHPSSSTRMHMALHQNIASMRACNQMLWWQTQHACSGSFTIRLAAARHPSLRMPTIRRVCSGCGFRCCCSALTSCENLRKGMVPVRFVLCVCGVSNSRSLTDLSSKLA